MARILVQGSSPVIWAIPLASKALTKRSSWNTTSRLASLHSPRCASSPESVKRVFTRSLGAAGFAGHSSNLSWRASASNLSFKMQTEHISTVVAQASSSVEVGGSPSKAKDRELLVQHLLVKEDQLQLLLELQRKITQEGLDLSDIAEEHSICPSSVEGGMLGWLAEGQTDPAFEEAIFTAQLNKLIRVKTKHGWHLLQVLSERPAMKLEQIDAEEFHERMQDPSFFEEAQLVDVREPDEISTASIKGFEAYPLSRFGQWAPSIADDLDPEKDTYVLCHHGMRSMQAAQWLQTQGFRRLYNIHGGIHAYSKKVDPSIPTY
ncbi:hypothetical protein AXG93_2852s1140 [Marchantia polymorpha subsp. ruderalis]|uniref:Peptidylprolyl isomerase n=1 Tax=Marchantia polymorpha subsp. ruderalis TaxID=1480154 RepID=A0A176WLW1_MARPO|nr:hypothetical protein AXG93_2852s1140 [Marchantia polymorpha subsp. ruderalis]